MPHTTSAPAPTNTHSTTRKMLHAFPHHSNVALCGKTISHNPTTTSAARCPDCEREATRKSFTGRP